MILSILIRLEYLPVVLYSLYSLLYGTAGLLADLLFHASSPLSFDNLHSTQPFPPRPLQPPSSTIKPEPVKLSNWSNLFLVFTPHQYQSLESCVFPIFPIFHLLRLYPGVLLTFSHALA